MFKFNLRYFIIALILFMVELLIAIYVRDRFIRPYVGDFLVIILIYCAVKSFINISPIRLSIAVFLFACCIEVLQYFHIVDRLGLSKNIIAKTVIGYGFEWLDILAYAMGSTAVTLFEITGKRKR